MEGTTQITKTAEDQVKELQDEIKQLKEKTGGAKEIKVGDKTYTVEQVEKIAKDAENVTRMTEEMRKQGEQANASAKEAGSFQQLQKKYGDQYVQGLLADPKTVTSDKLLPDLDLEGVEPEVMKFENERNQRINDFAKTMQDQIGQLTNAVKTLAAKGVKWDTTQDEGAFAQDQSINLQTAEGVRYLDSIKEFGKENGCFELHGAEGNQYHVIDKKGLDAAVLLMNLRDGRKAASEGDVAAAELAMKNLLGGDNTLGVKFEPTPSRQAASMGAQLDPILAKFNNNEPLTKKEVSVVKEAGWYVPSDYPTKD